MSAPSEFSSLTIVSMPPPIPENPYQRLLYGAIAAASENRARIEESADELFRNGDQRVILHVHWIWLKKDTFRAGLGLLRAIALLERARRHGWKIVWTAHNLASHEGGFLQRTLDRRLARVADGIISHGEETQRRILAEFETEATLRVIPHGHYLDAYPLPPSQLDARKDLGLDPSLPVFLFFGQVRPYKGIERLVSAFARTQLDATLLVAGNPRDRRFGRKLSRLARTDRRIRLDLGFVLNERVPTYFAASDWVVLPFLKVTTSGTLILALGFGRPVIIPAHPALLEVTGDEAAITFDGEKALVRSLEMALERDAIAAGSAALERARALDWQPIGRATLDFFRTILAQPSGQGPAQK